MPLIGEGGPPKGLHWGFRAQGLGFRLRDLGFRIQGLGFFLASSEIILRLLFALCFPESSACIPPLFVLAP